jgi:hypothetical protein
MHGPILAKKGQERDAASRRAAPLPSEWEAVKIRLR